MLNNDRGERDRTAVSVGTGSGPTFLGLSIHPVDSGTVINHHTVTNLRPYIDRRLRAIYMTHYAFDRIKEWHKKNSSPLTSSKDLASIL